VFAKDYTFVLAPGEKRSVLLEAECWNQRLAAPKNVPGKLTPLKGKVSNTTDVWGVSGSVAPGTTSSAPSLGPGLISALANADRGTGFATSFLEGALNDAVRAGADPVAVSTLRQMVSPSSGSPTPEDIIAAGEHEVLRPRVTATKLREFLIRQGYMSDVNRKFLSDFATTLYVASNHTLHSELYRLTCELRRLEEQEQFTIDDGRKAQLTRLTAEKVMSIVDALPLLDKVHTVAA